MKKLFLIVLAISFICSAGYVCATPLNGEYSITSTFIQNSSDSYTFNYAVTNINQGGQPQQGLEQFYIMVPLSATISAIVTPPSYEDTGYSYWVNGITSTPNVGFAPEVTLPSGYQWLYWVGVNPPSVYPPNSTAYFGFTADNVSLTQNYGVLTTYWRDNTNSHPIDAIYSGGGYYSGFSAQFPGPGTDTAVPEPSTIFLLGTGLFGLGFLRKRFRK